MKSQPKRSLSSSQTLVVLVMIAVVVWAVGLIVSKAVFDTVSFNNRLISRKRSVDSTLGANLQKVDELKSKYEQVQTIGPGSDAVLQALPDKEDLPGLVSTLEALLVASGVSFDQFSLTSGEAVSADGSQTTTTATSVSPTPQELTFTIQISGSYQSILQTLENIEHEISPMRVTDLEIGGTVSNATAKIDIKTFYQDRVTTDFPKETLK